MIEFLMSLPAGRQVGRNVRAKTRRRKGKTSFGSWRLCAHIFTNAFSIKVYPDADVPTVNDTLFAKEPWLPNHQPPGVFSDHKQPVVQFSLRYLQGYSWQSKYDLLQYRQPVLIYFR